MDYQDLLLINQNNFGLKVMKKSYYLEKLYFQILNLNLQKCTKITKGLNLWLNNIFMILEK